MNACRKIFDEKLRLLLSGLSQRVGESAAMICDQLVIGLPFLTWDQWLMCNFYKTRLFFSIHLFRARARGGLATGSLWVARGFYGVFNITATFCSVVPARAESFVATLPVVNNEFALVAEAHKAGINEVFGEILGGKL